MMEKPDSTPVMTASWIIVLLGWGTGWDGGWESIPRQRGPAP
ncbi:hypothetical protein GCM10009526_13960 [Glutamicibacter creatinolyticus]